MVSSYLLRNILPTVVFGVLYSTPETTSHKYLISYLFAAVVCVICISTYVKSCLNYITTKESSKVSDIILSFIGKSDLVKAHVVK
jgi:hypothetical protein